MKHCNCSKKNLSHLVTPVLSKLHTSHHLLINEICCHLIVGRIVPRSENLFTKEQPPRSITFGSTLLFGVLLTLRYGIHHVIATAAEGRHLKNKQLGNRCKPLVY